MNGTPVQAELLQRLQMTMATAGMVPRTQCSTGRRSGRPAQHSHGRAARRSRARLPPPQLRLQLPPLRLRSQGRPGLRATRKRLLRRQMRRCSMGTAQRRGCCRPLCGAHQRQKRAPATLVLRPLAVPLPQPSLTAGRRRSGLMRSQGGGPSIAVSTSRGALEASVVLHAHSA